MKYAVEQKFFDSGHITAKIITVEDNTEDMKVKKETYDLCIHVFTTKAAAEAFLTDILLLLPIIF